MINTITTDTLNIIIDNFDLKCLNNIGKTNKYFSFLIGKNKAYKLFKKYIKIKNKFGSSNNKLFRIQGVRLL